MTRPTWPWLPGLAGRIERHFPALRRFDLVAVRLALLAMLSGVPLAGLAVTVLVENYVDAQNREARDLSEAVEAASGQARIVLADAAGTLRGLAAVTGVGSTDPAVCSAGLAAGLSAAGVAFRDVSVLDANGVWRCGTGAHGGTPIGSGLHLAGPADPRSPLVLTVTEAGLVLQGILPATRLLLPGPDAGGGARAAVERASCWVAEGDAVVPLGPAGVAGLPTPAMLSRLMRPEPVVTVRRRGSDYLYTAVPLGDSVRLIVGSDTAAEHRSARRTLLVRAAWLALLTLAGLCGLVLGVRRAVVEPLRLLGMAVGSWRSTGRFVAPTASLPVEVRALCDSFGRATTALSQREAELARAVEQQELAMQEIHHRVKNNLQIVASLLNLQASRIRLPEAKAEFQSARDRVRALATLHRHLYAHGEVHTINMRSFLVELCGQLFQAMGENEGARIALDIEAPELRMLSDQAVPLALVVTEAVSNALKYAFPGGRQGRIGVHLTEEGGFVRLEIQDDGVGIPAGKSETETGTRDGIGLQLIRGFSRQLGATLDVQEGNGTRYILNMKVCQERENPTLRAATG
ncbi:MAG: sensor histidine kinase [Janthinobacterium lividum]